MGGDLDPRRLVELAGEIGKGGGTLAARLDERGDALLFGDDQPGGEDHDTEDEQDEAGAALHGSSLRCAPGRGGGGGRCRARSRPG